METARWGKDKPSQFSKTLDDEEDSLALFAKIGTLGGRLVPCSQQARGKACLAFRVPLTVLGLAIPSSVSFTEDGLQWRWRSLVA